MTPREEQLARENAELLRQIGRLQFRNYHYKRRSMKYWACLKDFLKKKCITCSGLGHVDYPFTVCPTCGGEGHEKRTSSRM